MLLQKQCFVVLTGCTNIIQVHVFAETGQHLETRSLFTDATLLQFLYDKSQRLATIKDQTGFVSIERNPGASEIRINLNQKMLAHVNKVSDGNTLDSVQFPSGKIFK